jgi:hypothetical protein
MDESDHVFLIEILIAPEHQNCGVGTELVGRVLARAGARGVPVRLQVLRANRARNLYERPGFQLSGATERDRPRRGSQRSVDAFAERADNAPSPPSQRPITTSIFGISRRRSSLVRAGFLSDPAAQETSSHDRCVRVS